MKARHPQPHATNGFSLLELLATIGIIALLATLLLPVLQDAKGKAKRTRCANNLRQIGIAYHLWAHEHEDLFPMAVPTRLRGTLEYSIPGESLVAFKHFQAISNELVETRLLLCPVDNRTASHFATLQNSNVSFAVNVRAVMASPDSILVADRNVRTSGRMEPGYMQFGPGDKVEWNSSFHVHRGNVLYGDGHVSAILSKNASTAMTGGGLVILAVPHDDIMLASLSPSVANSTSASKEPSTVASPQFAPQQLDQLSSRTGPSQSSAVGQLSSPTPSEAPSTGGLGTRSLDDTPAADAPALTAPQITTSRSREPAPNALLTRDPLAPGAETHAAIAQTNQPAVPPAHHADTRPHAPAHLPAEEPRDDEAAQLQWLSSPAVRATSGLLLLLLVIALLLELERRRRRKIRANQSSLS